jgi:hypothetical protein
MVARFETFRGTLTSWNALFSQAAEFVTELGPDDVISISHSSDQGSGVVTVWYWEGDSEMSTGRTKSSKGRNRK